MRRASRSSTSPGRAPFRSLELAVGPGVFVPRPETEFVTQLAIDALLEVPGGSPRAIDLGTGSGAIALALATEVPQAEVVAVENSPRAFIWARQNVREVGATNLRLVFADLADAVPELDGTFDVVVSNPPYIPVGAIPRDPEVRLHDPEAALYGGADGLDVVRVISRRAQRLLRPGGTLVLEHGEVQGDELRALLAADGWRVATTHRDLLGRDRATTALRPLTRYRVTRNRVLREWSSCGLTRATARATRWCGSTREVLHRCQQRLRRREEVRRDASGCGGRDVLGQVVGEEHVGGVRSVAAAPGRRPRDRACGRRSSSTCAGDRRRAPRSRGRCVARWAPHQWTVVGEQAHPSEFGGALDGGDARRARRSSPTDGSRPTSSTVTSAPRAATNAAW